jgi:hypothetical protein
MTPLLPTLTVYFLLALSLGTAAFTWIAEPRATGAGFMKLITGHGLIALLLAAAVDATFRGSPSVESLILYATAGLSLAFQWRFHPDGRTPAMWFMMVVQVIAGLRLIYAISPVAPNAYLFWLSSAIFLGVTHYAMLLGHYYLVVPKLSEKPLLVSLLIFWGLLFVKVVWSLWSTTQAVPYLVEGSTLGDGFLFNALVVTMRWLWGYLALAILSFFAWRLCRMRSIQSATGVLYIMVFFVFVGELLSGYLFLKHGLAI